MSIDVQSAIWQTCLYSGGTLNVLLSMADFASPDGRDIFPGLEYLAARCRQTPRATQDCIKRLRADKVVVLLGPDGEDLEPDANPTGGRGNRTEYRIDLKRVQELQALHQAEEPNCLHCLKGRKPVAKRVKIATGKGEVSAAKGEENDAKGEKTRAHIDNHQEPSEEPPREPSAASPRPADAAPQSVLPGLEPNDQPFEIPEFLKTGAGTNGHCQPDDMAAAKDIYNEAANELGWVACQHMSKARCSSLRQRLKSVAGLDGWRAAMNLARQSPFLRGETSRAPGHENWRPDIDFFLKESHFTKLMEGGYGNGERGKPASSIDRACARAAHDLAADGVDPRGADPGLP